ncbi:hypothetical protein DPQ33_09265 [Oceanidesulfovibrio indonesiensis]|uniref:Uncharacterized protein n=2 Tax=Oceanidesulfovibrio indonesiensis TaxID=54767 RepID=A0A7M3MFF5_9BACT|nr:hypothetical protein DPQ33_09265 [Oceanidesulfovibrio indonesiensis]
MFVVAGVASALAPLGDFDLTVEGVPSRVREKVRDEYEFPYVIVGHSDTYYIKSEETIAPVRQQFLNALESRTSVTVRGHVLMVLEDLLVIDEIYSLTPAAANSD